MAQQFVGQPDTWLKPGPRWPRCDLHPAKLVRHVYLCEALNKLPRQIDPTYRRGRLPQQIDSTTRRPRMEIMLNGQPHHLAATISLGQLLEQLALPALESGIAIAVNGELVRRAEWGQRQLEAADEVEIVSATQGG